MPAPFLIAAIPEFIKAAKDLIDRYVPDKTAAQAAKDALDKQESTEHFQIALRQIDTNIAEIQAGGWLGKWRGALGWGLTLSAIYQLILVHFITFVVLAFDPQYPVEKLPKLDWQELGKLLMGMLGLA
jgi:hypothetical protein